MTLSIITVIAVVSLGYGAPVVVSDDQSSIAIGARMMSLGGMLGPLSRPSDALTTNPAALANIEGLNISSMYANLLGDVGNTLLYAAMPAQLGSWKGNLGIGYMSSDVGGIYAPSQSAFNTFEYGQRFVWLGWGSTLRAYKGDSVELGGAFKFVSKSFSGSVSAAGTGTNLDTSLQVTKENGIRYSLLARNILPASLGGRISWAHGATEVLRRELRFGATLPFRHDAMVGAEMELPIYNQPLRLHFGMEYQPVPSLQWRIGLDSIADDTTAGRTSTNLTAGIGIELGGIHFDYAYHPYASLPSALTHYFSLGFGDLPKVKPQKAIILPPYVPELQLSPIESVEQYLDVSQNHWAWIPILQVRKEGIMVGHKNGQFRPEDPIKFEHLRFVIQRLQNGVYKITLQGNPSDELTRRQVIWALAEGTELTSLEFAEHSVNGIDDTDPAAPHISAAEGQGLLALWENQNPAWGTLMTRSELAEVVSKLMQLRQ